MAWWGLGEIEEEMNRAVDVYGPFHSTHEAFGVLAEEVDELLYEIRANDIGGIAAEARQVAAVAARLLEACRVGDPEFRKRSGL